MKNKLKFRNSTCLSTIRFALRAAPSLMIECATHFESKGELEKAVQLFYKVASVLTFAVHEFHINFSCYPSVNLFFSPCSAPSFPLHIILRTLCCFQLIFYLWPLAVDSPLSSLVPSLTKYPILLPQLFFVYCVLSIHLIHLSTIASNLLYLPPHPNIHTFTLSIPFYFSLFIVLPTHSASNS